MSVIERRWFGTDGIRGPANQPPLQPAFTAALGSVLGADPTFAGGSCLIARDPRPSGPMLESALASGLMAAGRNVILAGVAPTPMAAWLALRDGLPLAAVISASHNPEEDNGIKLFGPGGQKLEDETETEIESRLSRLLESGRWPEGRCGGLERMDSGSAVQGYVRHLLDLTGLEQLSGLKIVVDCANGAMTTAARHAFSILGANAQYIGCEPETKPINAHCGCMHPENLLAAVKETGADVGIAFDGDGDRILMCDESGVALDGDDLLAVLASGLQTGPKTIIATVMSNEGLIEHLQANGFAAPRAGVGDRQVLRLMRETGAMLGGEQSGHIVQRDLSPTGDGLACALRILSLQTRLRAPLSALRSGWERWPQLLRNIRLKTRKPWKNTPVEDEVQGIENELAGSGRIMLRYSGTEPLLRVLLEGRDKAQITACADRLQAVILRELAS